MACIRISEQEGDGDVVVRLPGDTLLFPRITDLAVGRRDRHSLWELRGSMELEGLGPVDVIIPVASGLFGPSSDSSSSNPEREMLTRQMTIQIDEDGSVFLPPILEFDFPDVEEGRYDELRARVETVDGEELTVRIPIDKDALRRLLSAIPLVLKRGR